MEIAIPPVELSVLLPEITLVITAIIVLMTQFVIKPSQYKIYAFLSAFGILIAGLLILNNYNSISINAFSQTWINDRFSRIFKLIFLMGTGLTFLISGSYAKNEKLPQSEYYFLLISATLGMMIMASSADLITLFLGLELMSICIYVLTGIINYRKRSIEAAIKYFILGSFASGFLLYGMALIYGATGSTNLSQIFFYLLNNDPNRNYMFIGILLLLVGLGFKIAVVPFHMWTPDVYEGAPAPITAFMSIGVKTAIFAGLIRIMLMVFKSFQDDLTLLLWVIAAITMTVGNLIALKQENVKRMLAYSSIAHTGYLMIGFVVGNEAGISAITFYLLIYAFMNIGAFGVVILIAGKNEKYVTFKDYSGLFQKNPLLTICMTIFMISLAGIPPTGGFMGKFYLFSTAAQANFIGLVIVGVLNSVVSVYYYLRVTIMMYMKDPVENRDAVIFSPPMIIALTIALLGVLGTGFMPSDFLTMTKVAISF